jgi:hypothetical protein
MDLSDGTKSPLESVVEEKGMEDKVKKGQEKAKKDVELDTPDGDISLALPPRQLRSRAGSVLRALKLSIAGILIFSGLFLAGAIGLINHGSKSSSSLGVNNGGCSPVPSLSFHHFLLVDRRVAAGLSFTQAKLIDIAWDAVVGQGGRFLHGWLLYRVASQSTSWLLEYSALPYVYQVDMQFSTVSLTALASAIRLACRGQRLRVMLTATWFTFAITYVLGFSTLWSAATSSVVASEAMFRMPDQSLVSLDSSLLQLCWSVDGERALPANKVVLGPKLDSYQKDMLALIVSNSPPMDWNIDTYTGADHDYLNLIACEYGPEAFENINLLTQEQDARTKLSIQFYFNRTLNFSTAMDGTMNLPLTQLPGPDWSALTFVPRFAAIFSTGDAPPTQLFATFPGLRFPGVGEPAPARVVRVDPEKPVDKGDAGRAQSANPAADSRPLTLYPTEYVVDPELAREPRPALVPYNSSLWLNGTMVPLAAPFLNLAVYRGGWVNVSDEDNVDDSTCSMTASILGECACYKGEPLPSGWLSQDRLVCVSSPGYVWGFSSALTAMGLLLELIWAAGCWAVWFDAREHSRLGRRGRGSIGQLRSALELAEAIGRDLGPHAAAYSDGRLRKYLARCPPVGYVVQEKDGTSGYDHVMLVPMPEVDGGSRRRIRFMMRDENRPLG